MARGDMATIFSRTLWVLLAILGSTISPSTLAAELKVVTSIKPIHSLASSVMQGVGAPTLIIDGAQSPHGFNLKPSQARKLQEADLVFWIGPQLETFLEKALQTIAQSGHSVPLIDTEGLKQVFYETHAHGSNHLMNDPENGAAGADKAISPEPQEQKQPENFDRDPHIWLDPENAIVMAHEIARALARSDPDNGPIYIKNAEKLARRLSQLNTNVGQQLAGLEDRKFLVFHDAYAHFEQRFGLHSTAAITLNPEVMPGAGRLRDLNEIARSMNIQCAFVEPQFDKKAWNFVDNGKGDLRICELDPLGWNLPDGAELYEALINNMAQSMKFCLQGQG